MVQDGYEKHHGVKAADGRDALKDARLVPESDQVKALKKARKAALASVEAAAAGEFRKFFIDFEALVTSWAKSFRCGEKSLSDFGDACERAVDVLVRDLRGRLVDKLVELDGADGASPLLVKNQHDYELSTRRFLASQGRSGFWTLKMGTIGLADEVWQRPWTLIQLRSGLAVDFAYHLHPNGKKPKKGKPKKAPIYKNDDVVVCVVLPDSPVSERVGGGELQTYVPGQRLHVSYARYKVLAASGLVRLEGGDE